MVSHSLVTYTYLPEVLGQKKPVELGVGGWWWVVGVAERVGTNIEFEIVAQLLVREEQRGPGTFEN